MDQQLHPGLGIGCTHCGGVIDRSKKTELEHEFFSLMLGRGAISDLSAACVHVQPVTTLLLSGRRVVKVPNDSS
jgi:hypothetical protein